MLPHPPSLILQTLDDSQKSSHCALSFDERDEESLGRFRLLILVRHEVVNPAQNNS